MATIGLDKLYYAKITEADNGDETYGTPTQLAKAILRRFLRSSRVRLHTDMFLAFMRCWSV
mgnify:CR=1 FL=1